MLLSRVLLKIVATVLVGGLVWSQDGGKVCLEGARIITIGGAEIEKGSILIENGKISAIGEKITVPFDAKVIDCTGKTLMPGIIDAITARGLDLPNENVDIGAFMQTIDALDPTDKFFEESLRMGTTSINVCQAENAVITAVSSVVRPIGMTVREMLVRAEGGVRIVFGARPGYDRAMQMAILRETFAELDRYLDRLSEQLYEEDMKKKQKEVLVPPAEARKLGRDLLTPSKIDDMHRNLHRLRQGRLDAFLTCQKAMDVRTAIEFAKKEGLLGRSAFVIGSECFKAATALKEAGRPVILPVQSMIHVERDRMTLEDVETFVPKVLNEKKISFALSTSANPLYDAARLVRNGLPRDVALASVTLNAAKALNLDARMGSLEVGKDGTVLVLSGDPLDSMTWVESTFIEGVQVYERAKDKRLRDILKGVFETASAEKKAAPTSQPTSQPTAPAPGQKSN